MIMRVAVGPGTPVGTRRLAFRGYTPGGRGDPRGTLLAPRAPLPAGADVIAIFQREIVVRHVLGERANHFVSLSLQFATAVYYGTTGGTRWGKVTVYELPTLFESASYGGSELCTHRFDGEVEILDPRHLPMTADALHYWQEIRNRAVHDDEILLSHGSLTPIGTIDVGPRDLLPGWRPWAEFGETLEGIRVGQPLPALTRKNAALIAAIL